MRRSSAARGTAAEVVLGLEGLRKLAMGTLAGTLALISLGGAVRATDSGLACPDWPACFGQWIPPADLHIWLEHSHRLLAGVIGLAVAALNVWIIARHRHRRDLLWPAVLTAVAILVQSGLGALVVLLLLRAELVTAHLGMAAVTVGLLLLLVVNLREPPVGPDARRSRDQRFARLAGAVAALVFVQLLAGGQATGVAAAYVFNAWPVWASDTAVLESSTARELFHLAHRFLGYIVGAAVLALAVRARREPRHGEEEDRWLVGLPAIAVGLVVVQIGLGIGNVLTQAQVAVAIGHLTGGILLWTVVLLIAVLARRRAREPAQLISRTSGAAGLDPVPDRSPEVRA